MFSEKAKKHADACRFCWMCRHLCPVEAVTGKETNTPRAKGLQVSMIERGMTMEESCARNMYECMLCGACTNDCVTGFDPLVFIREARTQANVLGLVPENVQKVINRVTDTGNIFGAAEPALSFEGIPEKGDILVWLGETARYAEPETAQALFDILKKAGVAFAALKNEPPSGSALGDLMGFVEDVRIQARAAAAAIASSGAKQVVVLDSYDAALMQHQYQEWGVALPPIVTATAFVDALIAEGHLKPRQEEGLVTYHDGSRLARDLDEHEPARNIIASMGLTLREMQRSRRLAKCCGSAVAGQFIPGIAQATARNRWADAARTEARCLVAACPQSTHALKSTAPEGYLYQDLFVLLNGHL